MGQHSLKSPGLLLTGLLLKVSIISTKTNNSEQKLTKPKNMKDIKKQTIHKFQSKLKKSKNNRTDKKNRI